MMNLCCEILSALQGKTLATAESCTGGGIGAALTAVPGSSSVYKGGIICYSNWVKEHVLGVSAEALTHYGAVSAPVAEAMALGADAVIGITYGSAAVMQGAAEVIAYGTAVKFR